MSFASNFIFNITTNSDCYLSTASKSKPTNEPRSKPRKGVYLSTISTPLDHSGNHLSHNHRLAVKSSNNPESTDHPFMDAVPFTWRARKGYIPAPTPEPEPEPTPLPPAAAATQIMVSHNYFVVVPQPQPLAYAAQLFQAAPVTIAAPAATVAASKKAPSVAKSTKSSSKKGDPEDDGPKVSPPPQSPPAPASEATLVEEPKKDMNEPPGLRPGMNYMFPAEHTKLHIFNKSSKVWEDKHTGKSL